MHRSSRPSPGVTVLQYCFHVVRTGVLRLAHGSLEPGFEPGSDCAIAAPAASIPAAPRTATRHRARTKAVVIAYPLSLFTGLSGAADERPDLFEIAETSGVAGQQSTRFAARPPSLVSLYFESMSLPVCARVLIVVSRSTRCRDSISLVAIM